jgi:putative flippase GtrA
MMLLIGISNELIYKLFKFCVVGFTGMIVDFGITFLLKEKARVQKYLANGAGFFLAATTNYFLNRVWTFKSTNPEVFIEYAHFIFISLTGLAINSLVLWLLVSKWKRKFYLAKFFAILVTTAWNFVANAIYTFN